MKKKKVRLEDLIMEMLERYPDSRIPASTLRSAFRLPAKKGGQRFEQALEKLLKKKKITVENDQVSLKRKEDSAREAEGIFSANRHGSGYVAVQGMDRDVRIPSRYTHTALDKDRVRIAILPKSRSDRTEGKVLDVLERGKPFFVGTFRRQAKNTWLIIPDNNSAQVEFFVHPGHVHGAKDNDKVIFRLVEWLHPRSLPQAEVLEVLGRKGTHRAAMLSVLAENEFQARFPKAVEDVARRVAARIPDEEYRKRRDLRSSEVFTIDPFDAKDFDDALSIRINSKGNYLLGVHIADVSYYVQAGSVLDDEARERATSVYLVDRVIPMLPESLSNGVCSLSPHEDKLTYSCFMEIDPAGNLMDYSIEEAVIHSSCRFTYEEVQEIIDGKEHVHQESIRILSRMASMLTGRRFREGSIDLDTPEPRFTLDENGKPLGVKIQERLAAHRLVEECMLMANKCVARHIRQLRSEETERAKRKEEQNGEESASRYPFLYRIHDRPDPEKIKNIAENVRPLGIRFTVKEGKVAAGELNRLIEQVNQTKIKYAIHELILRSMAKAVYSPRNIGHYGLGFKEYTHFTSPIRRYPDLIIHRLLKQYAAGVPGYQYSELLRLGDHCSKKERDAVIAERDSIKIKQVEYLSEHIGSVFGGVISGVTDNGLYVMLNDIFCEGMVAVRDLHDDYYIYEAARHQLRGRNRGKIFRLGDDIRVKVVRTDMEQRQIDFAPDY